MTDIGLYTPKLPDDWPYSELSISILFIHEEDGWCARALDLDLEAYGESKDEAALALQEMIVVQVAFAIQKKQPGLIMKSAEPIYWKIYHDNREAALRRLVSGVDDASEKKVETGSLSIPDALIQQYQKKKPFKRQYVS